MQIDRPFVDVVWEAENEKDLRIQFQKKSFAGSCFVDRNDIPDLVGQQVGENKD